MPKPETYNVPDEVTRELIPILAERDSLQMRLDIAKRLAARAVRVAAAGLGLDPDKPYSLSVDCKTFNLEGTQDAE
jgi:hypothetical protein